MKLYIDLINMNRKETDSVETEEHAKRRMQSVSTALGNNNYMYGYSVLL